MKIISAHNMLSTATKPALTMLSKDLSLLRLQAERYGLLKNKFVPLNSIIK